MKYFYLVIVFIPFLFLNSGSTTENISSDPPKKLKLIRIVHGGCDDQKEEVRGISHEMIEPGVFSIKDDSLSVFVSVEYICCTPFKTKFKQEKNTLLFLINDICKKPYKTCYCRCHCVYTFDFKLVNFERRTYDYKIILNDAREEEPFILKEGKIDLKKI